MNKIIDYFELDCEQCFDLNEQIHGFYEEKKAKGEIKFSQFKLCSECLLYGLEKKVNKILGE